jgi:hypothetical protein
LGANKEIFSSTNTRLSFDADTLYAEAAGAALITTQVFRDVSAWYHILFAWDTTQATSSNRSKLYVNGTQVTSFSSASYPTQNANSNFATTTGNSIIGQYHNIAGYVLDGYLADVHFIDGQQLDPSSFAETNAITGQWVPKTFTGSYGTNGFKLNFSDNSTTAALGTDTSGNGNTWTVNNLSVTAGSGNDSLVDTPTSYGTDTGVGNEVRGNYATLNALDTANTLSNGNLQLNNPSTGFKGTRGTVGMSSGKWYFETTFTAIASPTNTAPALYKPNSTLNTGGGSYGNNYISIVEYPANTLNITLDGWSTTAYSQAGSLPAGTIVGIAFDADSGKIWFSTNGTWLNSGNPAAGTGAVYSSIPAGTYFFGGYAYSTSDQLDFNFGARSFAYTAPSGFKALVDTNLPAPVVAKGSSAMDVKLYTGNGGTQSITGLNFNPDFVWLKSRSSGSYSHNLYDAVRGATKILYSDSTSSENTDANGLTAFNSDGFSLGSTAATNASSTTYVGWCWDAGTSTVTNTAGSITSQVRANASAGFSVITYTGNATNGASVGHGLGVQPSLVIIKKRNASEVWVVHHGSFSNTARDFLVLNATDAVSQTGSDWFAKSSTTITFTNWYGGTNASGDTYVMYAFAPVSGYSSFGSYTGNGSTDGTFVYTGFRVKWYLVKQSSASGENWRIIDATRSPYNVAQDRLLPNSAAAEAVQPNEVDFLSNGFKFRSADGAYNASGATYIYAAFAESPLQYSRAR